MTNDHIVIMLVDDSSDLRAVLGRRLSRQGYKVVDFASGEEAITFVSQAAAPISYVFMDHVLHPKPLTANEMSALNGIETTRRLMELDPNICVVVFSGQPDISEADRQRARQAGACRYVYKRGGNIEHIIVELIRELGELRELRSLAEEARQQRERLATILKHIPVGTLLLDKEGIPWVTNHEWREIEEKIDPRKYPVSGLAEGLFEDSYRKKLAQAALDGQEKDGLALCEVLPGRLKYVHTWARPVRNAQGKVAACSLSAVDETGSDSVKQMPLQRRMSLIGEAIQRAGYDRARFYKASEDGTRVFGLVEVGGGLNIDDFRKYAIDVTKERYLQEAIRRKGPRFSSN